MLTLALVTGVFFAEATLVELAFAVVLTLVELVMLSSAFLADVFLVDVLAVAIIMLLRVFLVRFKYENNERLQQTDIKRTLFCEMRKNL